MIDFFLKLLALASIPYGILWIGKLLWRKKGEKKMTKKLTPWEKQYRQILRDMKSGKIIHDNNFYLIDFDGLLFLVRGDLCPVGYDMSCRELLNV